MRGLVVAVLAVALVRPAAAEELRPAAQRVAASLLKQLEGAKPAVTAVAVAPLQESGTARGTGVGKQFAEALSAALKGKLQLRDWEALDKTQREKALLGGGAQLTAVQALILGDAAGGDAGAPVKASVRVVSVATGQSLATDSASLGKDAAQAAAPRARNAIESASVDVAMRKIADQLVEGFARMPGNVRYRRLAVMPFSESGGETKKRELGAVVTAELSTSLRRDHGLLLVERAKLQQVMGEIKLGQSGAVESSSAPEIGKLSDAQALVLGSVAEAGDRYLIDARIVATETAENLASASESVPAANLVAFSSDAVVLRSRKDALFRSVLIPGWGQIYNREAGKGYLFMGAEIASIGAAVALAKLGSSAESDYKSAQPPSPVPADWPQQVAALKQKAEDRYTQRNIAIAVAGSVWLLNILDAYFSGVDGDRLLGGPVADVAGGLPTVGWIQKF